MARENMGIGIDFGTTHSGAAWFDGHQVHLFALDPQATDPAVVRSALYVTREQQVFIGQTALDTYYAQNSDRPSKMVRQYVGEIEIELADVGSVKGYPAEWTRMIRDVYVMIDELTPGRLLQSLKSGLSSGYGGTALFGKPYTLEGLIALYLGQIRERVEAQSGQPVEHVVLGRPVHFVDSEDEADDRAAEHRLREAARQAGFDKVSFELEPVATALYYAQQVNKPKNVIVFDLGGGTLDITVMRTGGGENQVFANGGLGKAGDVFDRRLIEGTLLDHFGQNATWGETNLPFPSQYTEALLDWQTLAELNNAETLRFLQLAQQTSNQPEQIQAFQSLLVNNDVMRLYQEVERAKIEMSSSFFDAIRLQGDGIDIWQPVTRSQFESLIAPEVELVQACVQDTLERSGLGTDEIDAVLRTGGSAQIPRFVDMLGEIFGTDKLVEMNVFSSVTAGLAIRAYQE